MNHFCRLSCHKWHVSCIIVRNFANRCDLLLLPRYFPCDVPMWGFIKGKSIHLYKAGDMNLSIGQLRHNEDTKIEVIVVSPTTWEAHHSPRAKPKGCGELPRSLVMSPTTWEAHHSPRATWEAHQSPRAKPEGCGELPRSLVTPQWPKSRYQFLFNHDDTKLMMNKRILSI